jgi:hypothetical protein
MTFYPKHPASEVGRTTAIDFINSAGEHEIPFHRVGDECYQVRLYSDEDCFVSIGREVNGEVNPDESLPLPMTRPEYFIVHPGYKITALGRDGYDGKLWITEMF